MKFVIVHKDIIIFLSYDTKNFQIAHKFPIAMLHCYRGFSLSVTLKFFIPIGSVLIEDFTEGVKQTTTKLLVIFFLVLVKEKFTGNINAD